MYFLNKEIKISVYYDYPVGGHQITCVTQPLFFYFSHDSNEKYCKTNQDDDRCDAEKEYKKKSTITLPPDFASM